MLSKLLLIPLVIIAGVLFYRAALRDPLFPKRFGVVEEGKVYRSGGLTPAGFERVVREHKIKTIVDLGGFTDDPVGEQAAARTAKVLGVARHTFNLRGDGTGDPRNYIEALSIITNPASHPVLVHCAAGSQRTGACIMLYRKITQGTPFETSLDEARRYDHDPVDNPKLMPYLADHGAAIESAVKDAIKAREAVTP